MERPARTLVLCFDGTGDFYDATNTNVVKLFSMLKKDNNEQQLVYYQAGIGTYTGPGILTGLQRWLAKLVDQGIAWFISAHVMGGYEFLMQNYCTGDRICLFGFSRGAYTARALAGMLYKVGLLSRDNKEQVGFAYQMYTSTGTENDKLAAGFKEVFCKPVKVEFIGCWDTVSSVGLFWGRHLPFTSGNSNIKRFRHALSLDERRAKFQPNLWHRDAPDKSGAELDPERASRYPRLHHKGKSTSTSDGKNPNQTKQFNFVSQSKQAESPPPATTDVLEVWFAGCHADIGGGDLPSEEQRSLSNIPLRWMVREIIDSQCGIQFDEKVLDQWGIEGKIFLSMIHEQEKEKDGGSTVSGHSPKSSNGETIAEAPEDALDAVQPLHDELKIQRLWWVLEVFPIFQSWQDINGVWHREFRWNLGRGRTIEATPPKLHSTVQARMKDHSLKYVPRAVWANKPVAIWMT